MTRKQIDQAYVQFTPLLHKLAHQCSRRCGRPEPEVFGEACYWFMQAAASYNPAKASFCSWLYPIVKNGLTQWGKKMDLPNHDPATVPDAVTRLSPDRQAAFNDWLANLSDECREVATLILNGPAEVLEIGSGKWDQLVLSKLKRHLRGKGWTWPVIWNTMRQMKAEVRSL